MSSKIYLTPESKRESLLRNKRNYFLRNKEKIAERRRQFTIDNPDIVRSWQLKSSSKPQNIERKRLWYENNKEKVLANKRRWALTESGKKSIKETAKRAYLKHKHKSFARHYTHVAIKRGLIKKGVCQVCGSDQTEAHHQDYSNVLDIMWLCRQCHVNHHNKTS